MPRGVPKKKGPMAGAALAQKAKIVGSHATGLEADPEILRARGEEAQDEHELDDPTQAMDAAEEALEMVGTDLKAHPIGNGTTVPMPFDGEMTTEVATCSKPVKDQNRGCIWASRAGGKPLCPLVGKGPFNIVYLNKRTGRVKTCFCTKMVSSYLNVPYIQILPGVEWFPTRSAKYKPLPNGQEPTPGPNQPRTPIQLQAQKTKLVCVVPEQLAVEYQKKRRRGDFAA